MATLGVSCSPLPSGLLWVMGRLKHVCVLKHSFGKDVDLHVCTHCRTYVNTCVDDDIHRHHNHHHVRA